MPTQVTGPGGPRLSPCEPSEGLLGLLSESPLFRDYQRAFTGTTGLRLVLVPAKPDCHEAAASRRLPPQRSTGHSCVCLTVGAHQVGCLQFGPFVPASRRRKPDTAAAEDETLRLDRRTVRAIARLLGVFARQLSELSNEMLLGVHHEDEEPAFVREARAYIAANGSKDLSLTAVARIVGISPFYFCKRFHEAAGLHFTEYVARTRVQQVKQSLLNPNVHVSEAAFAAGFRSLSQFNRAFRRIAGEAPSDYRHRLHPHLKELPYSHAA